MSGDADTAVTITVRIATKSKPATEATLTFYILQDPDPTDLDAQIIEDTVKRVAYSTFNNARSPL